MASITTRAGKGSPLTNNEVDANFTNLNDDKQEILAEGAFVNGDKNKLDGIEANATADQTAGEIKTAYESNADTNAFTDAEQSKLSGIEANADVTDTENVTAAGALMDSEVANLAQVKAFDSADYATAAQGDLADTALQPQDVGTAAALDVGTGANNVVQLDSSGALPAVDGSNLTNVSSVASINDLTDVTITSVSDGESLVYDSATSQWINETVTPVALSLPFFDSAGLSESISLIANQNLPFFRANGTQDNIAVVS